MKQWMDNSERYGLVTRALHWGMAALLMWQFGMIAAWKIFDGSALLLAITTLGPYHGTVGLLTIGLVVLRAAWAAVNRKRRPAKDRGWLGKAARAGHVALYVLMFAIPALALARVYGSGKGWVQWDVTIIPATGVETPWLTAPANTVHAVLAWMLCALIVGHIAMALVHRLVWKDATLARMAGRLALTPRGAAR